MKKLNIVICLSLMVIMISSFAMAQSTSTAQFQLNPVWYVGTTFNLSSAVGSLWTSNTAVALMSISNSQRQIDISTVENKVIIADKGASGLGMIFVANTLNGFTTGNGYQGIGSLDTTVLISTSSTGATYNLDKARVAADGAIYATNLTLGITAAANLVIYRWANTTSAGTVAFYGVITTGVLPGTGVRFGDALAVDGAGTGTEIYIGGSGANCILKFTSSNGTAFTLNSVITTSGGAIAGIGGNDIGPVSVGGNLWTSGPSNGLLTQLVSQAPGANYGLSIDTIASNVVTANEAGAKYFTAYGHNYVLKGDGNVAAPAIKGYLVDVTNGGTNALLVATTQFLGITANANGTGGAAIDANNALYFCLTNNAYGKFTMPLSVSPTTIAGKPNSGSTPISAQWGLAPYTWAVHPGIGSISTTAGANITYSPGSTYGTDTITLTDSNGSSANVIVTISPTSAPLAPEKVQEGFIRSEPVWTFME